jgi:drug/metabolite transporter (DMT)-like permease
MKYSLFLIIALILLTDTCDTVGQLLLKKSINSLDVHVNSIRKVFRFILEVIKIPRVWLSFVLSIVSLFFWLFVLSKTDLSFAFSLDSMRYLLIALASAIFLKERVGPIRWLGIASVVLGIALVAAG